MEASMEASVEVNFLTNFMEAWVEFSCGSKVPESFHEKRPWKQRKLPRHGSFHWTLSRASTKNADGASGPALLSVPLPVVRRKAREGKTGKQSENAHYGDHGGQGRLLMVGA